MAWVAREFQPGDRVRVKRTARTGTVEAFQLSAVGSRMVGFWVKFEGASEAVLVAADQLMPVVDEPEAQAPTPLPIPLTRNSVLAPRPADALMDDLDELIGVFGRWLLERVKGQPQRYTLYCEFAEGRRFMVEGATLIDVLARSINRSRVEVDEILEIENQQGRSN